MDTRSRRTTSLLPWKTIPIIAAVVAVLAAFATSTGERPEATDWQPAYGYCLDDAATGLFTIPMPVAQECDGNPAAGFPSDTRTTLTIPSGMYNFGGGAGFTPAGPVEAQDQNIPLGAVVGRLASKATLGLIGNPCSNSIDVFFTFQFSSLDLNDTIKPKLPGQTNQLEFFAFDDDGDGLPNAVEKYPEYLKKVFDPDYSKGPDGLFAPDYGGGDDVPGPTPPLQPIARATGFSIPAGTGLQVVLNILIFPPGSDLKNANNTDMPAFDASLGYPVGTVLQDPTVPVSPGAVSDFCSPLDVVGYGFGVTRDNPCTGPGPTATNAQGCAEGNPAYPAPYPVVPDPEGCDGPGRAQPDPDGNEASCATRKNPAAGTYSNVTFARSLRDDDNDGIENNLDTCALVPSPGYNPRAPDSQRDPDGDGLPSPPEGCDPLPNQRGPQSPPNCTQGNVGPDTDGDCYSDRQDNCAAVLLGDGTIDINKSYNKGQEDQDADGIGDTCDPNPTTAEGHRHEFCINIDVTYPTSVVGVASAPYAPPCAVAATPTPTDTPVPTAAVTPSATPTPVPPRPPNLCAAGGPGTSSAVAHDISLDGLRGTGRIRDSQAKTYTAIVTNHNLTGAEDIQICFAVVPMFGCSAPEIDVALPYDATPGEPDNKFVDVSGDGVPDSVAPAVAHGILPDRSERVKATVFFSGCPPAPNQQETPFDYIVQADACHEGDPAPKGFFGGPCTGAPDGANDPNQANDAPIQKAVNDVLR